MTDQKTHLKAADVALLCINIQTLSQQNKNKNQASWDVFTKFKGKATYNPGQTCCLISAFYHNWVKVELLLMHFSLSMSLMWLQARPMRVRRPRLCSCGRSFLSGWPTSWRKLISSLTSSSALHPWSSSPAGRIWRLRHSSFYLIICSSKTIVTKPWE